MNFYSIAAQNAETFYIGTYEIPQSFIFKYIEQKKYKCGTKRKFKKYCKIDI